MSNADENQTNAEPLVDPAGFAKIVDWFQSHVRPFLQDVDPDKIESLESDARNLQSVLGAEEELAVCFLGNAGVGKSTLINALVAGKEIILPAGGIGPLTAQALAVRYAPKRRFEVDYHPPQAIWQLAFSLETVLRRDARRERPAPRDSTDLANGLDADARDQAVEFLAPSNPQLSKKLEALRRQAQLLILGDQNRTADLE